MIADALVLGEVDNLHGDELRAVGHHVEGGADRLVLGQDSWQDHSLAPPGLVLENLDSVSPEIKQEIIKNSFARLIFKTCSKFQFQFFFSLGPHCSVLISGSEN